MRGGRRRAGPRLRSRCPPRTLGERTSPPARAPTVASGASVPAPEGSTSWRGAPRPLRRASTQVRLAATAPSGHLSAPAPAGGRPVRLPSPAQARRGPQSGRDWQGPQMAAAPRRGWSRGGGRAPSRGSRPGALGVLASPLEGRTDEAPREPAGAGTAAAETRAGNWGVQETREARAMPGPYSAGWRGPRDGNPEERVCAAVTQAPAPAGLVVPDAAPDPLPGQRKRRMLTQGRVSGTWHLGTRHRGWEVLGRTLASSLRMPRAPSSGEAERRDSERQSGARLPGVLSLGSAGVAGAWFACGWSPTTKAIPRGPNDRVREAVKDLIIRRWVILFAGEVPAIH